MVRYLRRSRSSVTESQSLCDAAASGGSETHARRVSGRRRRPEVRQSGKLPAANPTLHKDHGRGEPRLRPLYSGDGNIVRLAVQVFWTAKGQLQRLLLIIPVPIMEMTFLSKRQVLSCGMMSRVKKCIELSWVVLMRM